MASAEKTFFNVRANVKSALGALDAGKLKAGTSKFELLKGDKHTIVVGGVQYYRIRALRRIERPFELPPVEPGDLGGYVASAHLLSDEGSCWVADGAVVSGYVKDDAQVTGGAFVGGESVVSGKSWVSDCAQVVSGAVVSDAVVCGFAQVIGVVDAGVSGCEGHFKQCTEVSGYSRVSGRSRVYGGAKVTRFSQVSGLAVVGGNVQLRKGAVVAGGVVLVSERGLVDLCGDVISEPLNMWGCPTVVAVRADDKPVWSVKGFADPEYGSVLPYCGDFGGVGVDGWNAVDDDLRDAALRLAELFGFDRDSLTFSHDIPLGGSWGSTFDKADGYPRAVYKSEVTGDCYFAPETIEEAEERDLFVETSDDATGTGGAEDAAS